MSNTNEQNTHMPSTTSVDDWNTRLDNLKSKIHCLKQKLEKLAQVEDDFTKDINEYINSLETFLKLENSYRQTKSTSDQAQNKHEEDKKILLKQLENWDNQSKSLTKDSSIKEEESQNMIKNLIACLTHLGEQIKNYFKSKNESEVANETFKQTQNSLIRTIQPTEDRVKSIQELIPEVEMARHFKNCPMPGYFDFLPLEESSVTRQIAEHHSVVTTFRPLENEHSDLMELNVECIPFFPPFNEKVKTRPRDVNGEWDICIGNTPYIGIRRQGSQIEFSWNKENIETLNSAADANMLLFSVLRFSLKGSNGTSAKTVSRNSQLLKPGTLKTVVTSNLNIPRQEDDEVPLRFTLATVEMEGLEFMKSSEGIKWFDTLLQDEGKYICKGFSGDTERTEGTKRPKIALTGNYMDKKSLDHANAESRVRLIKTINDEKVELVLFEQCGKPHDEPHNNTGQ